MVQPDQATLTHFPQAITLRWEHRTLQFRRPASTSRGALTSRETYIVHAACSQGTGEGECCIMPGLLKDITPAEMQYWCDEVMQHQTLTLPGMPSPIRFGLESAVIAAQSKGDNRWDSPFSRGEEGIRIHGLIWMADIPTMLQYMHKAIAQGFTCLKMKVGAHPFTQETEMLQAARQAFPNAEIRLDANGAWEPREAHRNLEVLARLGISFIEQPVKPGQWQALAELCRHTPIPIALDEELIYTQDIRQMLETIRPQGVVIKPSLHGGLLAAKALAEQAESQKISWWVNSALESHVGLETLAEWCGLVAPHTLHGLGTGQLFVNDASKRLCLEGEFLRFH